MKNKSLFLFALILIGWQSTINGCTIFSSKDKNGHVWAGNNEDYYFTFGTYLNTVARTDSSYGYIYFSYFDTKDIPQGGVNEAGLFFDANALDPAKTIYKDYDKKKDFPGGFSTMLRFIMNKCKNVREVLDLFEEFRIQGLEAGQLHFADKYGNLGIVVADSMWITKSNFQVSTNYNLCHTDKDGIKCWRFPIAERILKTHEACLYTFREICDSTSRRTKVSTIFSNIHDLNTGDIWFYYGMNYNDYYKTTINDLLKNGNSSVLMYELFLNEPLVRVYKTYQSYGVDQSLKELDNYQLPVVRKNEILRLLSYDLIMFNHDLKSYKFLSTLMNSNIKPEETLQIMNAVSLFCLNKKNDAFKVLKEYISDFPESNNGKNCLNRMKGKFEKNANVKLELKGHEKANYVFVEGFSFPNTIDFLIKKRGKWIGEFKLLPNEYHYYYSIDGKRVLDPNNPEIIQEQGLDYNKIIVKK